MPLWVIILACLVVLGFLIAEGPNWMPCNWFFGPCESKNPERLRRLLAAGRNPNSVGWFGMTPLGLAVFSKREANIRLLLEAGADPNQPSCGALPLGTAADGKFHEGISLLLAGGADPNLRLGRLEPPIVRAVESLEPSILKLFLNTGADPNFKHKEGYSLLAVVCLGAATKKGRTKDSCVQLAEVLLQAGANPNERTHDGVPMLGFGLAEPRLLRLLVDHGAILETAWEGRVLRYEIEEILSKSPPQ